MIRHYLITAFRTLSRNKVTTAIHIVGLALGIFSCLCIWLYISDEMSYDGNQSKLNRIYRLNTNIKREGQDDRFALTSFKVVPSLCDNFSDIESGARLYSVGQQRIRYKENEEDYVDQVFFADSTFFQIFDAGFTAGNAATALMAPNSIVLTKKQAEKMYGSENPIGKTIHFTKNNYLVTGVVDPECYKSNVRYNALLSMNTLDQETRKLIFGNDWYRMSTIGFLLLKPGVDPHRFEQETKKFVKDNIEPWIKENQLQSTVEFFLHPLKNLRFVTDAQYDIVKKTNKAYIYIFALTGIFILLIACFNYINLSTASAAKRAKEVAVRKVSGAAQMQLVRQFMGESLLLTILSVVLALVLLELLLPWFNSIAEKSFVFQNIITLPFLAILSAIILVISLLGGLYPALFIARFEPVGALRGQNFTARGNVWLRKFLVVLQFSLSTAMIITTIIIFRQLTFMRDKDTGFRRENILAFNFPFGKQDSVLLGKVAAFKEELEKLPGVKHSTVASHIPGKNMGRLIYFTKGKDGKDEERVMATLFADQDFLKMMDVKLLEGRFFDKSIWTDVKEGFILNEAAVKYLGWQNPVGMEIQNGLEYKGHVIGVVRDFNFASLQSPVEPLVILVSGSGSPYNYILADISGNNTPQLLRQIREKWKAFFMSEPFKYFFMDDTMKELYSAEDKMFKVFCYFSLVAILISCMGVFGLAMFITQQRTKEIGIRKVMGASEFNILLLLNRDFVVLVFIAVLIASPLAWLGMQRWLEHFAYRTPMNIAIVCIATLIVLLLAFLTVSLQTFRTAIANPVTSLRYE